MEGWEFATLQGMWEGLRWVLRLFPFIIAVAVIIAIWREYRKTQNIKEAKHLLEIKSTDTAEINRVISELRDYNSKMRNETIDMLIQKLRQLRDNLPSKEEEPAEFIKPTESETKMPTFSYKALDKNNKEINGTFEADNEEAVLSYLKKMECYPVEVRKINPLISNESSTIQRLFPTFIFPSSTKFSKVFWVIFLIAIIAGFIAVLTMK